MIVAILTSLSLVFLMVRYVSLVHRIDRHQEALHRFTDLLLILQKQDLELLQTIRLISLQPTDNEDEQDNDIQ